MEENKEIELPSLMEDFESKIEDYFELSQSVIDDFDEASRRTGIGYECPKYPLFNKHMEGLGEGLYLFAAESNCGKTATMMEIAKAYACHEPNKLLMIYYSLDDTANQIIPRFISADQMIPIMAAAKPLRIENMLEEAEENKAIYQDWLNKRQQGIDNLKALNRHLLIIDGDTIHSGEEMLDHAKKVQMYVKTFDPEYNILVCIDSVFDLRFNQQFSSETAMNEFRSEEIKRWAKTELKVPIFASIHVRKVDAKKKTTIEDIKQSGRYQYDASAVFVLNNEISKMGDSANIFIRDARTEEKIPVIEMSWEKNKVSSFKKRTYYAFYPKYSKVIECSEQASKQFDTILSQ